MRAAFVRAVTLLSLLVLAGACGKDVAQGVASAQRVSSFALAPGQRVAVMTFAGSKGAVLSELVSMELLRRGVDVVDRDSLDRLVAEIRRSQSGAYDGSMSQEQIIRQLGRIVNADVIVYGESHAVDPNTIQLRDEAWMRHYRRAAFFSFVLGLPVAVIGGVAMGTVGPVPSSIITTASGGGLFLVGVSVMGGSNPWDDYGSRSPKFYLADSSLAIRAFSTRTGEVVWWGNMETYIQAEQGEEVTVMDHLRVTAKLATLALTDPRFSEYSMRAEDSEISREFWPSLSR